MLIKMQKGEQFADVHPDEVENYKPAGWTLIVCGDGKKQRKKQTAQAQE